MPVLPTPLMTPKGANRPTNYPASLVVSPEIRVAATAAAMAATSTLGIAQQYVARHRMVVYVRAVVGGLAPLPESVGG